MPKQKYYDVDNLEIGNFGDFYEVNVINAINLKKEFIEIPTKYNGKKITHIGYDRVYFEPYQEIFDYHHFKYTDHPARYELSPKSIKVPDSVKRIYVPSSVRISDYAFKNIDIIIDSDNYLLEYYKNRLKDCNIIVKEKTTD